MESYELKRGAFKNLTLRIKADGSLRVSAPWFAPRSLVDAFVAGKEGWIAEKRRTLPVRRPPGPVTEVSVWGVVHRVEVESPGRIPRVVLDAGNRRVVLRVPAGWGSQRHQRILEDWEKTRVAEVLARRLPEWTAKMNLRADRWSVKRMRSRWGSCQPATRSLVFNARLGAMPPECLEHVVVHELVHLMEPSHNARFHALVEQWLPGSRTVRALLRKGTGTAGSDAFPDSPSRPGEGTALGTPPR